MRSLNKYACAAAAALLAYAPSANAAFLTYTFKFAGTGDRLTQDRSKPEVITYQNLQGSTLQFTVFVSESDPSNGFGGDTYTNFSAFASGPNLQFRFSPEPFQSSFYAEGSGNACLLGGGTSLPMNSANLAHNCGEISYVSSSRAGYLDNFTGKLTYASVSASETGGTTFSLVGYVPEPTTWAMMLIGFGMVGAATRYRRKSTAVSIA